MGYNGLQLSENKGIGSMVIERTYQPRPIGSRPPSRKVVDQLPQAWMPPLALETCPEPVSARAFWDMH